MHICQRIFRIVGGGDIYACRLKSNNFLVNSSVISIWFWILCISLSASLWTMMVNGEPSTQQEQELLLLDALSSKRLPPTGTAAGGGGGGGFASTTLSNYGSSNTIMDMLGRSMHISEKITII